MAGYNGYSMSNNAILAYEYGEKPLSKWTKTEILEQVYLTNKEYNYSFDLELFSKLKLTHLKGFLHFTSWHHTSSKYNKTNFYSIDTDKLELLTNDDIVKMLNFKSEKKEKEPIFYITALVQFDYWSGTKKRPKKEELEEVVYYMSNEKMVRTSVGNKRLSSLYIVKKVEQKTKFAKDFKVLK